MKSKTILRYIGAVAVAMMGSAIAAEEGHFQAAELQDVSNAEFEDLRRQVRQNEELLSTLSLSYTEVNTFPDALLDSNLETGGGMRIAQIQNVQVDTFWAQKGFHHHISKDVYKWPDGDWLTGSIDVKDSMIHKYAAKPSLNVGSINDPENMDLSQLGPGKLGLRPFEGEKPLSELLGEECVIAVRRDNESGLFVVDMQYQPDKNHPDRGYYGRFWLDANIGGLPTRIEHYDQNPNENDNARMMSQFVNLEHIQLPNMAWLPVSGKLEYYRPGVSTATPATSVINVNVDSITIDPGAITEDLFDIEFPSGAQVYNNVAGVYSTDPERFPK